MYCYCHKCEGLLTSAIGADAVGMYHCGCISRGTYPQYSKARLPMLLVQGLAIVRRMESYACQKRGAEYFIGEIRTFKIIVDSIIAALS